MPKFLVVVCSRLFDGHSLNILLDLFKRYNELPRSREAIGRGLGECLLHESVHFHWQTRSHTTDRWYLIIHMPNDNVHSCITFVGRTTSEHFKQNCGDRVQVRASVR